MVRFFHRINNCNSVHVSVMHANKQLIIKTMIHLCLAVVSSVCRFFGASVNPTKNVVSMS